MQEMNQPQPERGEPFQFSFNPPEAQSDLVFGWQVEGIQEPTPVVEPEGANNPQSREVSVRPSLAEALEAAFGTPEDHFDITQFDGMAPDRIGTTVVDRISHGIFATASEMYPDFVFPAGDQEAITLEHQYPSGEHVRVQSFTSGSVQVYVEKEGVINWHNYARTPKGSVVYRQDNPLVISDLPAPGEVPGDTIDAIGQEKYASEAPIRKLAAELGDGPHLVSIPEMRYVACVAANAEPRTVTAYEITQRVRARVYSPLQPSDERAATAAPLFDTAIQRFLERNKLGTDTNMVVVEGDAIDPLYSSTTMQVQVGRKWSDHSENLEPFMELRVNHLLGPEGVTNADGVTFGENGKQEVTIQYAIQDGKLQSTHHIRILDHAGDIEHDWTPKTANAETEDVRALSHFLRKPKFNVEP